MKKQRKALRLHGTRKLRFEDREIRRKLFKEMMRQGRRYSTLKKQHTIIFYMEEFKMTEVEARHKFGWRSWDYDRQVIRLYAMRKKLLLHAQKHGHKEFAGPVW